MTKKMPISIILMLLILIISGCSPKAAQNGQPNITSSNQTTQASEVRDPDIHDKNKVARYVIDNLIKDGSLTEETFINNKYNFKFSDLTGDNYDEAVLEPVEAEAGWYCVYVIESYQGAYRCLLKEEGGKYGTQAEPDGQFLKVVSKGGGTGVIAFNMKLFRFKDNSMVVVSPDIDLESTICNMNSVKVRETIHKISGPIDNFEYTLTETRFNQVTGTLESETIIEHKQFVWNKDAFNFNITELPKPQPIVSDNQKLTGEQVLGKFTVLLKERKFNEASELCSIDMIPDICNMGYSEKELPVYLKDMYGSVPQNQIIMTITEKTDKYIIANIARGPGSGTGFGARPEPTGEWKILLEGND